MREATALRIPTVALIDSDCDPDVVDLPIPGNDDGIRSIEIIVRHLADAVAAGNTSARGARSEGDDSAQRATEAAEANATEGAAAS